MNELQHYGVLGMKWGKRKARKQEKLKAKIEARKKALERVHKSGQSEAYIYTYYSRGKKKTDKILDRMAKKPHLDFTTSANRELGKDLVKTILIIGGGAVVGDLLARAGR